MPAFTFRAVDGDGKAHKGIIEATTEVAARGLLRDQKILPLSVAPSGSRPRPEGNGSTSLVGAVGKQLGGVGFSRSRISARSLATTTRQLSTLIGSDVRIDEALKIVAKQTPSQQLASTLLEVRSSIIEGQSFANALAEHPRVFPDFYKASIAAGEHSGKLPHVLEHLAVFVENRQRAHQKIRLALLYPALLATVSGLMIVLLLIYVVPSITKVFVSRGADLPLLTRGLIGLSSFIQSYGWILLALMVLGGFLINRWLAVPANRLALDGMFAMRRPFSGFSRQVNAARFAGSLATLVQSGVPIVDALVSAAAVTPNRLIRERTLRAAGRVREGASLHRALQEQDVYPTMLTAIVASGESSGRLAHALGRAAQDLDRDVDALTSTIVGLVEPAVLLFMGGVVMLMVLSILLPIISLNSLSL